MVQWKNDTWLNCYYSFTCTFNFGLNRGILVMLTFITKFLHNFRLTRTTRNIRTRLLIFCFVLILYNICASIYYPYYITPSSETITDFELFEILQNQDFCQERAPFWIILVLSTAENLGKRMAIRETWGNYSLYPMTTKQFKLLFLIFERPSKAANDYVVEEGRMYKDILFFKFPESYFHSTYKIISGFKWIQKHCPGTEFIAKSDDDVYLNIPSLMKTLDQHMYLKDYSMLGSSWMFGNVHRFGKHAVNMKAYPFFTYPQYIEGALYVMSSKVAFRTIEPSSRLTFVWPEDVFITGIVRDVLQLNIVKINVVKYVKGCDFLLETPIASCELSPNEIRETWIKVQNKVLCS